MAQDALGNEVSRASAKTLQGMVEFDAEGDIKSRTVSVYQARRDGTKPLGDPAAQFRFIFTAPEA